MDPSLHGVPAVLSIDTSGDLTARSLPRARLIALAISQNWLMSISGERRTDAALEDILQAVGGAVTACDDVPPYGRELLVETDTAHVWLHWNFRPGYAQFFVVAAETEARARDVADRLLGAMPQLARPDDGGVDVTFWSHGEDGPESFVRHLAAHEWAGVAGNYAVRTRAALDRLIRVRPPLGTGQLVLFHGTPGTGKTHALRALLREWRGWCDAHYVTDPEKFFGRADYMMRVILRSGGPMPAPTGAAGGASEKEKWTLLVVEDADEFVSAEAKRRVGPALGRLLNMVDGILGQGLRIALALTANESIEALHPAVVRPGRCLANIHFDEFTQDEAGGWLERRGRPEDGVGRATIAQLYGLAGDVDQIVSRGEAAAGMVQINHRGPYAP